jgi:kinesin family protein 11
MMYNPAHDCTCLLCSYTMEGDISSDDHMGVIPRSVHAIFEALDSMQADYTTRVSFLELYNEELQDLLVDTPAPGTTAAVAKGKKSSSSQSGVVLREGRTGVVVCGLEEVQVLNASDIFKILERGIRQRSTAATLMNKNSSRSHSIFTIKMMIKETLVDGQEFMRHGQLNLVDLAGSECVGRSGATDGRAREAGNINQSLLTLGRVITALVEKHGHIPYRDSKLTRLLQESLGGRARTCIISTVTSSSDALEETISTLDYALKAKSIENRPQANERLTKKHMMKEVSAEIETLRSMLQATREKNGIYLDPAKYDQMENTIASQANQIMELEQGMEAKTEEVKTVRMEKEVLVDARKKVEGELNTTKQKLSHTEANLTSAKADIQSLHAAHAKSALELKNMKEELGATRDRLAETEEVLSFTEDKLNSTERKLAETKESLRLSQTEVAAHAAIVREQKQTEEALQREAAATKRSLEEAVNDVSQLHIKRARLEEDAAAKRQRALELESQVADVTAALASAVSQFHEQHDSCVSDLRDSLTSAAEASKLSANQLASLVTAAMARAEAINQHMTEDTLNGSEEAIRQLASAAEVVAVSLAEQQAAISEWQGHVESMLGNLQEQLTAQAGEMRDLSSSVASTMEAANESIEGFVALHAQELEEVRKWAEAQLADQARSLEEQKQAALAFADQRRADVQNQADLMVSAVSKMMDDFKNRTVTEFKQHSDNVGVNYDQSISACCRVGSTVSSRVEGAGRQAQDWSRDLQSSLDGAKAESVARISAYSENITSFGGKASVISGAVKTAAENTRIGLDPISTAVAATNSNISKAVQQIAQRCDIATKEIAEAKQVAGADAASHMQGFGELLAGQQQVLLSKAGEVSQTVEQMKVAHASNVTEVKGVVSTFVGDASLAREDDGAPRPRDYPCPSSFSNTRSHSTIMQEVRMAQGRGGDGAAAICGEEIVTPPPPVAKNTTPPPIATRDAPSASLCLATTSGTVRQESSISLQSNESLCSQRSRGRSASGSSVSSSLHEDAQDENIETPRRSSRRLAASSKLPVPKVGGGDGEEAPRPKPLRESNGPGLRSKLPSFHAGP